MVKPTNFDKISVYRTPENSPGFLLWRTSTLWRRAIEDALRPLDLTHPQFVVLATVGWLTRNKESVSQVAVGRQAGLDPNTTSQILRGLQAKGLVERLRTTNERSKDPTLTAEGSRRLAKALPAVEKADIAFFASLGAKEEAFIKILRKLGLTKTD